MGSKHNEIINQDIDVLILCGGKGTRFEEVSNSKPKVLAEIQGIPLIDIIINNLEKYGFSRFILAVGFRYEQIIDHFKETKRDIIISDEKIPLGTGGAIKFSEGYIKSNFFMVMNGDLLCDMNYSQLIKSHIKSTQPVTLTVSLSESKDDYGNISLGPNNSIEDFKEKPKHTGSSYVSAGTYIMDKKVFRLFPDSKIFSIEKDFFEKNPEKLNAHIIQESFLDIGTPERFKKANKTLITD